MCVCVCSKFSVSIFYRQHALRLAAFGQIHKVLGMDPLPSKMPKKPRTETPIDYTGMSILRPPSTAQVHLGLLHWDTAVFEVDQWFYIM